MDQLLAQEKIDATPGSPDDVLWGLCDHLGTVRDLAVFTYAADGRITGIARYADLAASELREKREKREKGPRGRRVRPLLSTLGEGSDLCFPFGYSG